MVKRADTTGNEVMIFASKAGATIHLKWALVAVLFAGGGLYSGQVMSIPAMNQKAGAIGELEKTLSNHCAAQTKTESEQREQVVEIKTRLENMSQDLRDIKQLLMRGQNPRGSIGPEMGPDS